MKGNLLLIAVLVTGLSAGLFYAWQVSVIPGTKRTSDLGYLEAMQSINREILNPWFFLIFFGPMVMMIISSVGLYKLASPEVFIWVLVATVTYTIGTVGVTSFGNVPLNNTLDSMELTKLSMGQLKEARITYEGRWNQFHLIRTVFSIASFALMLWASKLYFTSSAEIL